MKFECFGFKRIRTGLVEIPRPKMTLEREYCDSYPLKFIVTPGLLSNKSSIG